MPLGGVRCAHEAAHETSPSMLLVESVLFSCRYLLANKLETRQRRVEVRKLKNKLAELEKRQNR